MRSEYGIARTSFESGSYNSVCSNLFCHPTHKAWQYKCILRFTGLIFNMVIMLNFKNLARICSTQLVHFVGLYHPGAIFVVVFCCLQTNALARSVMDSNLCASFISNFQLVFRITYNSMCSAYHIQKISTLRRLGMLSSHTNKNECTLIRQKSNLLQLVFLENIPQLTNPLHGAYHQKYINQEIFLSLCYESLLEHISTFGQDPINQIHTLTNLVCI